jgi:hypothetical protein
MTYTRKDQWGDHMLGTPNVYTYEFSDGTKYVQRESKNIVTGGFTNTVHRVEGDKELKSTLRELNDKKADARRSG